MDKVTKERIDKLHPSVRSEVEKIILECDQILTGSAKVRISQGLRTFDEQNSLYSQGRTKPGKKVTNAKGGQSIHNYGLAVDIVLIINGNTASWDTVKDWDGDKKGDWMEVVSVFKKYGWNWGGDWKSFKDLPHFEKLNKSGKQYNWRDLKNLKTDKQGYVII